MKNFLLFGLLLLACSFYLTDNTVKPKNWYAAEANFQALLETNGNSGKGFHYQAVIRDNDGAPKSQERVKLQFSLLPDFGLPPTWQETHEEVTNNFGVFSVTVGKGTKSGGSVGEYKDVDFAAHDYWLKVELDEDGNWTELGISKIPSMPYAEVANAIRESLVPVGSIMPFAGPVENIPDGWLLCRGQQVNRIEYSNLYNVIGTAWGNAGGNPELFHIPDLRSMFLRGVSHGRIYDEDRDERVEMRGGGNTGDKVGSRQNENFHEHDHTGTTNSAGKHDHRIMRGDDHLEWGNKGGFSRTFVDAGNESAGPKLYTDEKGDHKHSFRTSKRGGGETRPDNAYVNYIIKY